jgi:UDP-N-acetylglucosamine--N-acetylmuramyl-(pentapeptide) pyrophosphoryl-undecaprenol N-acetylglucosamine transferase
MLHLALLSDLKGRGWQVSYVGSSGIEKEIIGKTDIPFFTISAGKLRRYVSLKNLFDIFKVLLGFFQCLGHFLVNRPSVVFSKGGFVSVPVVIAAWVLRVPVIIHESDVTPGLANRISAFFARAILYSFPETGAFLDSKKSQFVGAVVRSELLEGDRVRGLEFCKFDVRDPRKVILIIGGSQGAQKINDATGQSIEVLKKDFRIIHLAGKGKLLPRNPDESYAAFEFVSDELKDIFAATDLAVGRAGANSIFEMLALHKPMLLIPLEAGSRGDQLVNARSFEKKNWALILREADLNSNSFVSNIRKLDAGSDAIRKAQNENSPQQSKEMILDSIAACM